MTIIYVAGPMSGIKDHNRPLFNMVAAELTEQSHSVLNPATLPDGLSQGQYMQICLPMVAQPAMWLRVRQWTLLTQMVMFKSKTPVATSRLICLKT